MSTVEQSPPESDPNRVEAAPERLFFVGMLIKDIELVPAINDLVDNSVDGARELRGEGDLTGLWIHLEITEAQFKIADNCGGIDAAVARQYAFRFGRPKGFAGVEHSVGQFGVGMKRAIFKLGLQFEIESRASSSRFKLTQDVEKWAADPSSDWTFRFDDVKDDWEPASADDVGTTITVTRLHDSVRHDLENTQTLARLRADLQLRHQTSLAKGLEIKINGEDLVPRRPELLLSGDIVPIRRTLEIEGSSDGDTGIVQLELMAGLVDTAPADRDTDEGDAENFRTPSEAGWYVFCNSRLVVAADKSPLTGWTRRSYHPQYRQFRGYAFLDSPNSALLPWNTTKTGLDQDSPVYRKARGEMAKTLDDVLDVINAMKDERKVDPEGPLNAAVDAAEEQEIWNLPESNGFQAPAPSEPEPATPAKQKIVYSVDREDFDAVQEVVGEEQPGAVGKFTFEHFLDTQV